MRLLVLGGSGQLGTQLRALALPTRRRAVRAGQIGCRPRRRGSDSAIGCGGTLERCDQRRRLHQCRSRRKRGRSCVRDQRRSGRGPGVADRQTRNSPHLRLDRLRFRRAQGRSLCGNRCHCPLNAYGRSKLAGEHRVSAANPRHVILRTAWLYSPHGTNFVRTILRLAQEQERLTVVDDQLGCPTAARDLAQACLDIALFCAAEPDRAPYGLYHFAGGGAATWFEFACAIVEQAAGQLRRVPQVVPISDGATSNAWRRDRPTVGSTARPSEPPLA